MALEIEGKLKEILPERSGEGRNGHWSVIDFVVEIPGQYPRDVAFSVWNNKIDLSSLQIGENLKVSFDASSRKSTTTGGYFTSLTAWKIEKVGVATAAAAPAAAPMAAAPAGPVEQPQAGGDDLPF